MNESAAMPMQSMDDLQETAASILSIPTRSDPTLELLLEISNRPSADKSLLLHLPFMRWIAKTSQPRLFVSLGSHTSVSHLAFCQAVQNEEISTFCLAIDTCRNRLFDSEGETLFQALDSHHETYFSGFSTPAAGSFEETIDSLGDGSIDILHIDVRHTYETIRRFYDAIASKLSSQAIILINGVNQRQRNFGVWRLWNDLGKHHPSFTFSPGKGIGIVAAGKETPSGALELLCRQNPNQIEEIQSYFAALCEQWLLHTHNARFENPEDAIEQARLPEQLQDEDTNLVEIGQDSQAVPVQVSKADARRRDLAAQRTVAARRQAIAAATALRQSQVENELLRQELADLRGRAAPTELQAPNAIEDASSPGKSSAAATPAINPAASGPVAEPAERVPGPVVSRLRRAARVTWWTVTLRLPSKLKERRRRINLSRTIPPPGHPLSTAPVSVPLPAVVRPLGSSTLRIVYISGEPDTPGHLYRIERYGTAVAELGGHSTTMRVDEIPSRLGEIGTANILVIWRAPWDDNVAASIAAARQNGAKIVFDVDDLMIDPNLARLDVIDGIRSQFLLENQVQEHYARVRKTMLAADICFTTTEELAFHLRWARKTTHVLPNGFDQTTHDFSRYSAREWKRSRTDALIRIGYAGGSRTHQRDFGLAAEAIARLLSENDDCRLVLFRTPDGTLPLIDIEEYPAIAALADRIEWRPLQPLANLPAELARLDINLAPLEYGNPFCEAKSELKFFEAALVDVPTVASPTGPFRRAIEHGKTGFLAASANDWYVYLKALADAPALRQRIAHNAYYAALGVWGPMSRKMKLSRVLDQVLGGVTGANAFALEARLAAQPWSPPKVFESDIIFERDEHGHAEVTVIIPLYNYEHFIIETLDSVHAQTLDTIDLVIVDGFSTDNSLAVAKAWAEKNAERFNRIVVLKNNANYGLAFCRNSGFDAARTSYVLPLDADNLLAADCCEILLETIKKTNAAFVYPTIQHFGSSSAFLSDLPFDPQTFVAGNFIDAMALVSKEAWAIVGGYDHIRYGWEDFDFWCRIAERGMRGEWQPLILAHYRVHQTSMMAEQTVVPQNYQRLMTNFQKLHPWVSLIDQQTARRVPPAKPELQAVGTETRLHKLLPILRCPLSHEKLAFNADHSALVSVGGLHSWPICNGRPVLLEGVTNPDCHPADHVSNELPNEALELIRSTSGLVLNLSAGGSQLKFDHVVEVEYAVFRHTDIVADSHNLPFDDDTFEAIVVMNAFEHYREPHNVAVELLRILKPGGQVLIRTAFLQPLHERPWHFFNCTQYGLAEWFKDFGIEKLHVSENFCPNHSIAWLASEGETALRNEVSTASADMFRAASVGTLVNLWRDPSKRDSLLWTDFQKVSQTTQEITAAGFELVARKPPPQPDLTRPYSRTS